MLSVAVVVGLPPELLYLYVTFTLIILYFRKLPKLLLLDLEKIVVVGPGYSGVDPHERSG